MDAFVAKHLQGVSRTYAIVVPMLPMPLADAVGVAYLLMRIVDTLEDAPQLTAEERVRELRRLEAVLAGDTTAVEELARPLGELDAERQLMIAAPEVFRRVRAMEPSYRDPICACAQAMGAGVCRLIARSAERGQPYPAIRDLTELREYCYYVAGTVGEMLCAMMAWYLSLPARGAPDKTPLPPRDGAGGAPAAPADLRDSAVELGIGLQLVNVVKDAFKDSRQGRRYLPAAAGDRAAQRDMYETVLSEARRCLQRGIDFVLALPAGAAGLRSFCGLPIAWGGMTLARAEHDGAGAKITRDEIGASIDQCGRLAGDDQALRQWLSSLLR